MVFILDVIHICRLLFVIIQRFFPVFVRSIFGFAVPQREIGMRLRVLLEERGLIYRKLGQYLAMRQDLLPMEICAELDGLFESATPMPFSEVVQIIESEFNAPLKQYFISFEETPIGSASVAQVHRAVASNGEQLAVKIQRGGIRNSFFSEVRNFRRIASVLDFLKITGSLSMTTLFDEFAEFTMRELDFRLEGRTADRLRINLGTYGHVPRIRWDLSSSKILSMEYIEGISLLTIARLNETGHQSEIRRLLPRVDLKEAVSHLAQEFFHQVFDTGFFHGDPHPANILLRRDGSFVLLDCGIFGDLSPQERQLLSRYTETLAEGNYAESARYYEKLCKPTAQTDKYAWRQDLIRLLSEWGTAIRDTDAPLENRHMAVWQGKIAKSLRKHQVRMGHNQLLVWRSLMLLDATALRLPNTINVHSEMLHFFRSRKPAEISFIEQLFTLRTAQENQLLAHEYPGYMARALHTFADLTVITQYKKQALSKDREYSGKRIKMIALAILGIELALFVSYISLRFWIMQLTPFSAAFQFLYK